MNHSLIHSVVAMRGLQQKLDTISNNIANMDTRGYKRQEASFTEVLRSVQQQPESFQQPGRLSGLGLHPGSGMKLGAIRIDMTQGTLTQTDQPLDLALEGDAMFEIMVIHEDDADGAVRTPGWTRDGSFMLSMNPDDPETYYMTTKEGHFVTGIDDEPIQIPVHHRIEVLATGMVRAYDERNPGAQPIQVAQLKLMQIIRPEMLEQSGSNTYRLPAVPAATADEWMRAVEETDGVAVRQGFLELSNVSLADELTQVMTVQRAFQLNSRAIQSADAMMNIANNLRGQ